MICIVSGEPKMLVELQKYYMTMDGRPVVLHKYDDYGTFPIKGSIYRKHKGRHGNPEYMTWKKNGMALAVQPSCFDLVEISTVQINDLFEKKPLGAN